MKTKFKKTYLKYLICKKFKPMCAFISHQPAVITPARSSGSLGVDTFAVMQITEMPASAIIWGGL